MSWCSSSILLWKIILVSVLTQHSLGYEMYEGDKRQGLIPLSRLGRAGYWTFVEEKKQSGGMMPYPRLGRHVWELPKTLIPYPRAGRLIVDPENYDYDFLMTSDYIMPAVDDQVPDIVLSNQPEEQKRQSIRLVPRIGRKKRSIDEDQGNQNDQSENESGQEISKSVSGLSRPIWDELNGFDSEYFFRPDRQTARSRNSFVPRVGKKSFDEEDFGSKRAVAFTPRIGRAPLTPRIGRDPRFKVKSRGAFIPRIGRRAVLTPRIGRSDKQQAGNEESK
ncbi:uncharacterized protein LOC118198299 isoform X1 [Stegodyphus dumicola]|uniref:uncharacterized protein LOC118198299 isoform X1 n=1 Tax=Stegodyphus dumicola TaxID=202533 RepID=UPI0015B19416|nr:uncharacterized protein LOC118198299 isoform X1 [Stegodyphus dumicola]